MMMMMMMMMMIMLMMMMMMMTMTMMMFFLATPALRRPSGCNAYTARAPILRQPSRHFPALRCAGISAAGRRCGAVRHE